MALTSRVVNLTDVLNLKYLDIVFLTNDRVSINCSVSPKIRVAVIKMFRKIVEKCP